MKKDWEMELDVLDLEDLLDDEPAMAEEDKTGETDGHGEVEGSAPVDREHGTQFERPAARVRQDGAAHRGPSKGVSRKDSGEDDDADLALDYVSLTGSLNEAMQRSSATEGEGWVSSMSRTDAPSEEQGTDFNDGDPHGAEAEGVGIRYESISGARRERRNRSGQESEHNLPEESLSGGSLSEGNLFEGNFSEEDDSSSGLTIEDDWFREKEPAAGTRRGRRRFRGRSTGSGRRGGAHSNTSGGGSSRRDASRRDKDDDEDLPRRSIPVHLILPVVIVIVLVVAVVRLLIWNRGVAIDTTTNENSFNVEVNDSLVILSSSDLEGAADDGVTTVLCLGNEPFSDDTSESGLAGQIAELGDVEVINAAFPDSQVTCENAVYSTDSLEDMDDIFNLFYVAYAIAIDDFSSLSTVASVHEDTYIEAVEALENTDFSAVDIIAIQYDGIDYINEMAMYNEDVPDELTTYVGSLANSFELLREAYPHIRIVFMSPWYAEYDGVSSRTTDLGNGTIVDYFQWAYDTCGSEGITFLDNYYGSVNENNFEEYTSDGVHLNADGCTKIADHFVYKIIQGNYAEYNVETMAVAQ